MRTARSFPRRLAAVTAAVLVTAAVTVAVWVARGAGCTGVSVTPSSNIQGLINSNPSGTTFCFASGTYGNASQLKPLSNDVFDGNGTGAVLDGGNTRQYAFSDGGTGNAGTDDGSSGVTIQNFKMQNYATPLQQGVIEARSGKNWIIQGNDIENNAAAAVATGDGAQVLNNKLDNNQQEGFSAQGTGALYQGNDISGNNAALHCDSSNGCWSGWEAGGGKAVGSTNLTFKNNTVDNNGGNGLWSDTNNQNTVYIGNTIDNNSDAGIYEEQSYDTTITGNIIIRNGMPSSPGGGGHAGYAFDAGIQLRRSGALPGHTSVISGNTVADNYNGITLIESPPSDNCGSFCRYFSWQVQNVLVEDNGITMTQGATGAWQDGEGHAIFTSNNNHFQGNNYCVSPSAHPGDGYTYGWFGWLDGWVPDASGFSAWQGYRNDTRGTMTVTTSQCQPPGGQAQLHR